MVYQTRFALTDTKAMQKALRRLDELLKFKEGCLKVLEEKIPTIKAGHGIMSYGGLKDYPEERARLVVQHVFSDETQSYQIEIKVEFM